MRGISLLSVLMGQTFVWLKQVRKFRMRKVERHAQMGATPEDG